ncbi:MAG: hypothetical protein ACAH83_09345 [Alphaproteobacteria bacterium]
MMTSRADEKMTMVCAALLLLVGAMTAQAATPPDFIGPRMPPPSVPVSRPPPPAMQPIQPGANPETAMPVLAPSPESKKDTSLGSVTCFACPPGEDTFHGAICLNGIACAAETVTLQRLNLSQQPAGPAVTMALRKLEAARAELKKPKGKSAKALQYINTAVVELKAASLKAGCKTR